MMEKTGSPRNPCLWRTLMNLKTPRRLWRTRAVVVETAPAEKDETMAEKDETMEAKDDKTEPAPMDENDEAMEAKDNKMDTAHG